MHDVFVVGVPIVVILAGILFGRADIARLEHRFDRVDTRLDRIEADLRQFYAITGRLEGGVDAIESDFPERCAEAKEAADFPGDDTERPTVTAS